MKQRDKYYVRRTAHIAESVLQVRMATPACPVKVRGAHPGWRSTAGPYPAPARHRQLTGTTATRTPTGRNLMEQPQAAELAHHRAIIALDIEQSTSRTDPVKAELRDKIYELFEEALRSAGIYPRHRDRFTDRCAPKRHSSLTQGSISLK
jgi:hypothetical protein